MTEIRVSKTQWQWMTRAPYTNGVFSCRDDMAAALVKSGVAEYVEADEFDTMKRRDLMKHAKSIGIKTSPKWKKDDVLNAIRECKQ